MNIPIAITAIASISPLGSTFNTVNKSYIANTHAISSSLINGENIWLSKISEEAKNTIEILRHSDTKYKSLDDTVLFAIYASKQAIEQANWHAKDNFGINIGSSRGATALFEKYHKSFLKHQKSDTLCSPTTTLGNISSWVAHHLQTQGPEISHSITCSTALHSLLNGIAWIISGMCAKFLVGGSEAPLTPFTIAQMQALKIYSKETGNFPCRALDKHKTKNTMILGEGAAMVCLEKGNKPNALANIIGVGYATEILQHNISISTHAQCFQKSMKMALGTTKPEAVDVIVMHAPGTIKGDLSELNAIEIIFNNNIPAITSNKWKLGHTFGASGALSLELAVWMLLKQKFASVPYLHTQKLPEKIETIMVNAVGFGGNAVSILLTKN